MSKIFTRKRRETVDNRLHWGKVFWKANEVLCRRDASVDEIVRNRFFPLVKNLNIDILLGKDVNMWFLQCDRGVTDAIQLRRGEGIADHSKELVTLRLCNVPSEVVSVIELRKLTLQPVAQRNLFVPRCLLKPVEVQVGSVRNPSQHHAMKRRNQGSGVHGNRVRKN